MRNTIALIPAYKPKIEIINLLKELKSNGFEIVVIDDGSGEEYKELFLNVKKYARLNSYEKNKGKGVALKTGLKYIKDHYNVEDIIVTIDCDGQHSVEDAKKLCKVAEKNKDCLIIGKRIRGKNTPLRSILGNSITRFIYNLVTGIDIYDTQTGLRAFSYELIDFLLNVDGEKYEYEMNTLLNCASNNIKIKEIEITTIYIDNNSGSHFNTIKDSIRIYKKIIKFSCSSLTSFVIDYIMYMLLLLMSNNLGLSNIIARIISAIVNYSINKKMVFKDRDAVRKSIIKYFTLVVVILFINTNILIILVNYLKLNALVAKLLTELTLFIFSYIIQNKIIFKNK